MKKIPLSKGKFALVDDEDFEYLNQWKWTYMRTQAGKEYAYRKTPKGHSNVYMHTDLLGAKQDFIGDHKDGDGLNNQRSNLRHATYSENNANARKEKGCTSKYKGVSFDPSRSKWRAYIGKRSIGRFDTEEEAARAYNTEAQKIFGQFASLNSL